MSYTIKLTNGATLCTVPDATENSSACSLTLVGRSYVNYGTALNSDLVHLLENFAFTAAPSNPLAGQLWYNTTTGALLYYTGSQWYQLFASLGPNNTGYTTILIDGFGVDVLIANGHVIAAVTDQSFDHADLPASITFNGFTYPFAAQFPATGPTAGLGSGITVATAYNLTTDGTAVMTAATITGSPGSLTVSGATSLQAVNAGTISAAAATLSGGLGVSGIASLGTISATAGTLSVTGGLTVTSGLAVSGTTSLASATGLTMPAGDDSTHLATTQFASTAIQSQTGNQATSSGTANDLAITLSPVPASLAALLGSELRVFTAQTNSGVMTLNVNGLGAKSIVHPDGSGLAGAEIPANSYLGVVWDGTHFQLLSASPYIGNAAYGGSLTLSGNAVVGSAAGMFIGPATSNVGMKSEGGGLGLHGGNNFGILIGPDGDTTVSANATFSNGLVVVEGTGNIGNLYLGGLTQGLIEWAPGANSLVGFAGSVQTGGIGTGWWGLDTSGNFTIGGTYRSNSSLSDMRLKENITPYSSGLDVVKTVPSVEFQWTTDSKLDDGRRHVGFIAQDVAKHLPDIAGEYRDQWHLHKEQMVPHLWSAVRQLSAMVESLQANQVMLRGQLGRLIAGQSSD